MKNTTITGTLKTNGYESVIEVYTYNEGESNYNNKYEFISSITISKMKDKAYGSFVGMNDEGRFDFEIDYNFGATKNITTKMKNLLAKAINN